MLTPLLTALRPWVLMALTAALMAISYGALDTRAQAPSENVPAQEPAIRIPVHSPDKKNIKPLLPKVQVGPTSEPSRGIQRYWVVPDSVVQKVIGKKTQMSPRLELHGNMGGRSTQQLNALANSQAAKSTKGQLTVGLERPLVYVIRDEQSFEKAWAIFSTSTLSSEPLSKPKINFMDEGAVLIVPYESRGGGRPPALREVSFASKKQRLVFEFDESDIFRKSESQTSSTSQSQIVTTSVMGTPWYFAVVPVSYLQKEPVARVRDW